MSLFHVPHLLAYIAVFFTTCSVVKVDGAKNKQVYFIIISFLEGWLKMKREMTACKMNVIL